MPVKNHEEVWGQCLHIIKEEVAEQTFSTWFEPIKPVKLEEEVLVIQVPSRFFYEFLEERFVDLLRVAIHQTLGKHGKLEYQISRTTVKQENTPPNKPSHHPNSEVPKPPNAFLPNNGEAINPFIIPGIQRLKVNSNLKTEFNFDSYIEGDFNRLARSAGLAVSDKPGSTSFNPLFIFGKTGLGKTHLAQAIGNAVKENDSKKNVFYLTSADFTQSFIEAVQNNALNHFTNFYRMIDVLILDDVHFLADRIKTQEIFFNIFNELHQNGRQLVLTSDRPPRDLEGMEERLISRFKWGLSAHLQTPDFETRIAIARAKLQKQGQQLPDDIVEFISYNVKDNIREIEGVLTSILAQATLNKRQIDLNLVKEVIGNFVSEISKEITIEFIVKSVADYYNLSIEKVQGKTRKRAVVIARQLSMYLSKNLTGKSLTTIGEFFGGRDHSTVIYSCRAVEDLLDTDSTFKKTVSDLEKKIKMSLNS